MSGVDIPALMLAQGDSVAVVLKDVTAGQGIQAVGVEGAPALVARSDVPRFNKVSLLSIDSGTVVTRNGVAIGRATVDIGPGDWVHVHNLVSLRAQPDAPENTQ